MDFSLNDIPISDPFLSLETDLNDVTDVIRHQWVDPAPSEDLSWTIEDRLFQNLPDEERSMEIGTIASLLQEEATQFLIPQPMDVQITSPIPPITENLYSPVPPMQTSPTQIVHPPNVPQQDPRIPTFGRPSNSVVCGGQVFQTQAQPDKKSTKDELVRLLTKMSSREYENLVSDSKEAPRPFLKDPKSERSQNVTKIPVLPVKPQTRLTPKPKVKPILASPASGEDSDPEDGILVSGRTRKPERRTAHNLIEKKYRCSINDRINQLKIIMAGEESKLSKSATLGKAITYIQYLQGQNEDLRRNNKELKDQICTLGGSVSPSHDSSNLSSPSESMANSPAASPQNSEVKTDIRPSRNPSNPMLDRSRVTMFVFMLCLVVMNPFQMMLGGSMGGPVADVASPVKGPGRTLQSAIFENTEPDSTWWHDKMFRMMCLWLLNGIVIACLLARLLIYGEPVTDAQSYSWSQFRQHKTQAQSEVSKGNLCAGARELTDCLRLLGRPLADSTSDQWAAFLWQLCRHLLNSVYIGRWLSKQRRGELKPHSVTRSHAEAALVYHKLNQLNMLGLAPGGKLCGLTLALSAVNLGQAAGQNFPVVLLAEIYVMAAFRFKRTLNVLGMGNLADSYFLNKAKRHLARNGIAMPPHISWIFNPIGRRYWNSKQRDFDSILPNLKPSNWFPFCLVKNISSPLDYLTANFKLYLLRKMLDTVLSARKRSGRWYELEGRDKTINGRHVIEILEWSHILIDISRPYDGIPFENDAKITLKLPDQGDELCVWWTHLLTCAVHWSTDDFPQAQRKYQLVRSVPKELLTEPPAMALGHAFCSRKVCLENKDKKQYEQFVWMHCCKSRQSLTQIESAHNNKSSGNTITSWIQLLVYDWLLSSCVDVWQDRLVAGKQYWLQPASTPLVKLFQQMLTDYRHAAQTHDWLQSKMLLYEAAGRMLSGANPVGTWQFLVRCSRLQRLDQCLIETDKARLLHLLQLHDVIGRM